MNLPFHGKGRFLCVPHPGKDQASCKLQLQLIRYNRAEISSQQRGVSFISAPWLKKPLTTDDVNNDDNQYNEYNADGADNTDADDYDWS